LGLEIERRFLVAGNGWRPHVRGSRHLQQGYLAAAADGLTVRVRLCEGTPLAWLTLKAPAAGIARHEFEYPVPPADARALLALAPHRLVKTRFDLDLAGGDWILDVFEADNAPLVLAEVELPSTDQAVTVPPWCVREITGRVELSNAALALRPFSTWTLLEQQTLLEGIPGTGGGPVTT
jgi:CYTH domain-containing protein